MSSQTTDTPGTTTTTNSRGSLRSNFSNLPGFRLLRKSIFQDHAGRKHVPQPDRQRSKALPESGLEFGGLSLSGNQLFTGAPLGDLENNTPTIAPPQTHLRGLPKPRRSGENGPYESLTEPRAVVLQLCVVRHPRHPSQLSSSKCRSEPSKQQQLLLSWPAEGC